MTATEGGHSVRCVLLQDRTLPAAAARERAIIGAGAELVATVDRWVQLLTTAVDEAADLVVLDLSLTGRAGVRTIGAVRALVPHCRVVAISELAGIDLAAMEAGADAVIDGSDLRQLTAALRAVGAGHVSTGASGKDDGPSGSRRTNEPAV